MKLIVNGEIMETSATTVKELLDELRAQPERVAVEVNFVVVKRAEYATFDLREGYSVEIVNFVGGG